MRPSAGTSTERRPTTPNASAPHAWARPTRVVVLAGSDSAALLAAGALAYLLWAAPVHGQPISLYLPLVPAVVLFLLGYGQAGLYPGFGLGPVEVLRRYALVTIAAFVIMAALVFGLKAEHIYSRATLGLGFVFSLVLIALFRGLITRVASRWHWWPEPVAVVGDGAGRGLARRALEGGPGREFQVVEVISGPEDPGVEVGADPWTSVVERAARCAEGGVHLAFADIHGPGSEAVVDRLRLIFPRVIVLRAFTELPVEGVQVRNLGGVLGLEYGNNLLLRQSRWVKRTMDLAVALPAAILSLPLMLVAMLAVRVASPGPALFSQTREGRSGRSIRVPKIRTMLPDAEARIDELLEADPELRREWEAGFKLEEDPRVVPGVGRFLRRFSIDELPQLWGVVKGDMSLVGPRPFPAYHLEALEPRARRLRAQVRPGISGLWQVAARGEADVEVQKSYDLYYIRNWSIWLDLYILSRTVSAVVMGKGAR